MTEKIVNKGFKIRLYPTDEQKVIIEKTFGCCRFIEIRQEKCHIFSVVYELPKIDKLLKNYYTK